MKTTTLAIDYRKAFVFALLVVSISIFANIRLAHVTKQKIYYGEIGAVKTIATNKPIVNINPLPLTPPQILNQVLPIYPIEAREQGIEGVTIIKALVGTDGSVKQSEIKFSSNSKLLDDSAVQAVSKWKFSPAVQGGTALASTFEIPITFRLQ